MRTWPAFEIAFPPDPPDGPALHDLASIALDERDVTAIDEHDGAWRVFFSDARARDLAAEAVSQALAASGTVVRAFDADDEDWARRCQADLTAIRVGRLVVAPPWDPSASSPPEGTLVIVIEPSMGFGSGHHATTRLCLDALQQLDLRGARVIDIGTGSGVLAIAAARLGASSALGLDIDHDALASARDAATRNGNPPAVSFVQADFRKSRLPVADVVLANLTGGMLGASATAVLRCCKPGGLVIASGITAAEEATVTSAFVVDSSVVWRGEEDGWVGLILRRQGSGDRRQGRDRDQGAGDRRQGKDGDQGAGDGRQR
jgi:ribosomal protein L11 methyltransferase